MFCAERVFCLPSNKTYKHRSLAETAIRHACIMQSNAAMPAWASLSRKAVVWTAVLHSHWYCTRLRLPTDLHPRHRRQPCTQSFIPFQLSWTHPMRLQSSSSTSGTVWLSTQVACTADLTRCGRYDTMSNQPPAEGRFEPGDIRYVRGVHHCRGIESHRCMTFSLVAQRFTQAALCLEPIWFLEQMTAI